MRLLSLILTVSISCLCFAAQEKQEGTLILSTITADQISGKYSEVTGHGIQFISKANSLIITTLSNQELVELGEPASHNEGEYRLVQIMGNNFLDMKTTEKRRGMDITSDEAKLVKRVNNIDSILQSTSSERGNATVTFQDAVNKFLLNPHSKTIIKAAKQMGEKEGILGYEHPAIMPFYIFALRLSHLVEMQPPHSYAPKVYYSKHDGHEFEKCLPQCPPCPKKDCIGMCGPHCTCWKWLCGDCCYHLGCFKHDLCCLYHGKLSVQCLSVWHFTCKFYWCKD